MSVGGIYSVAMVIVINLLATQVLSGQHATKTNFGVQTVKNLSNIELINSTKNQVADLASMPIEYIQDAGIGPYNRASQSISLQPVIPMKLSRNWMPVSRTIIPLNWQARMDQPS